MWTHGPRTARQCAPPHPGLEQHDQLTLLGFGSSPCPQQGAGLGISHNPRYRSSQRPRCCRHRDHLAEPDRRDKHDCRLGIERVNEHRFRLDTAGDRGPGYHEDPAGRHHRSIMMNATSTRQPTTSEHFRCADWNAILTTIRV